MSHTDQRTIAAIPALSEYIPEVELHAYTVHQLASAMRTTRLGPAQLIHALLVKYEYLTIGDPYPRDRTEGGDDANYQSDVTRTRRGEELQQRLDNHPKE